MKNSYGDGTGATWNRPSARRILEDGPVTPEDGPVTPGDGPVTPED